MALKSAWHLIKMCSQMRCNILRNNSLLSFAVSGRFSGIAVGFSGALRRGGGGKKKPLLLALWLSVCFQKLHGSLFPLNL